MERHMVVILKEEFDMSTYKKVEKEEKVEVNDEESKFGDLATSDGEEEEADD
jgi:hypothetical protein